MSDRFGNIGWRPGTLDKFCENAPETEVCFFNLIETPNGFEFEMHVSGERQIPIRKEDGDKFRGTYRVPGDVKTTGEMLQMITEEASKAKDPIPLIQRLLHNCRWQPGNDKGFGN